MIAVTRKFGNPAWDLAATAKNTKAERYFTPEQDSLKQDWRLCTGVLWLNPPYGNIEPWARKCALELSFGHEKLLLVPASVGSNWFWKWVWPYAVVHSVGRMAFDNCFNKDGDLVTTPYPKDLILAHYNWQHNRRLTRWQWKEGKL